MIPNSCANVEPISWQAYLRDIVETPEEIAELLGLDAAWVASVKQISAKFPMRIPRSTLKRLSMVANPQPVLRQLLAQPVESRVVAGYTADPVGEVNKITLPGMIQKYTGRALLTLTQACAVHCRYCFRREFPYNDNNPGKLGWLKTFAYLAGDESIKEVILSGGDPLSLDDKYISWHLDKLTKIPHLQTIRFHTRLPIFIPERITNNLSAMLANCSKKVVIVFHSNHATEISEDFIKAALHLHSRGIILLNQSVLLKGVNDSPVELQALSEKLISANILPYYLHLLDKVQGAHHFDVDKNRAKEIMAKLTARAPGYLVPKLVVEQAGAEAKTAV